MSILLILQSHSSLIIISVENVVYDCLDVLHAAVSHFNFISVEDFVKGVIFWERVSIRCKKDRTILVVILLLNGGLNVITL